MPTPSCRRDDRESEWSSLHLYLGFIQRVYYQIPVAPEDQEKTAFATPTGKYEFCRMPFGLKGAPATFQRAMDNLLRPYTFADAYIDDIVVCSDDWEQHLQHLAEVLHCLKAAGFTAKLVKCSFAKTFWDMSLVEEQSNHKYGRFRLYKISDAPRPRKTS